MRTQRIAGTRGGRGQELPPSLTALMMQDLSIASLRSLSPLPENAQKLIDDAVVRVGLDRLVVVADLLAAGLTYNLTDPLSVMELQWDMISKAGGAQRTMSPEARGENQLPDRTSDRVPIYCTTDDFFLGVRTLRASQRSGQPLDTSLVEESTRRVNEAIEDAAINGADVQVGGYDTPGLLDTPNAYAYGSNEAWDATGHDGQDILDDVLGMIEMAHDARRFGPYNLYVPTAYGLKLQQDFKLNTSGTIMARLQEIQSGGRNLVVRVADQLPANRTALVQMTSDVIDVVNGQAPTTIPWTSGSGMTSHWLVLAIMVPRIKLDYDGNSGIVSGNTT